MLYLNRIFLVSKNCSSKTYSTETRDGVGRRKDTLFRPTLHVAG
jgi:hypothetical protein